MKFKNSYFHYCIALAFLLVNFGFLLKKTHAQTYVPITNYHNGIDIGIQGTEGADYVFDRYYYDPLVNDVGLCYIKSDVPISLAHNANNSRIHYSSTIIQNDDLGVIRYKVDQDYQREIQWAGDNDKYGYTVFPAYTNPISFDNMTYPQTGEAVMGSTGLSTTNFSDRKNLFAKGMLDEAGNEYHYFTYADDDDHSKMFGYQLESCASDGKSMLFCVNPKTPAIWLNATSSDAEYYTTPAKSYYVPKIHEQISYVTDNININLKNIMNSNSVYYRIDGGSYQQYTGAISSNTLSDGQHTLDFYYDAAYVKTRTIIKNPDHPCKQDVFEDGTGHGYILWKNEAEFLRNKERVLNGSLASRYQGYKSECTSYINYSGNNGVRNPGSGKHSLYFAMVAVFEGVEDNIDYIEAAKIRLLNNARMHIENIGWEYNHSAIANPSHELTYRGYVDDNLLYANAFTYDLVAKYYRSDQFPGGMTPIQDYRIRDMLAVPVHESLMIFGGYNPSYADTKKEMWTTARQCAMLMAALAMPSYNTHYLGTSGFDGTQATHQWTPYPDYPASWKDVYLTYTDRYNPGHTALLSSFPNRESLFNWYDGEVNDALILADGNWVDRVPYASPGMMGTGFEYFYNVMRKKFNKTYPKLHLFMEKSINGTLEGNKFTTDSDYGPKGMPRRCMANEYFPDLAPVAIDAQDPNDDYWKSSRPFNIFFHNPDWASASICESTVPPTVPANVNGIANLSSVNLSWTASTHTECGVMGYNVYRDGNLITTVTGTKYLDEGLFSGTTYEYTIDAISTGEVNSAKSIPLQVTTDIDDILPSIKNVLSTVYNTELLLVFSEDMDQSTSENISNYSIDNGIAVTAAQLQADNKTVSLTVSQLSTDINYTVTVNNVEDAYGGNSIAPNSTEVFVYVNPTTQINVALNKTTNASGEQSGNGSINLIDENTSDGSRWSVESYPQWTEIDLGGEFNISRFELYTYKGRDYQYTIEISSDGENYTTAVDRSENTETAHIVDFVTISGRYVKLTVIGAATYTGTWVSINELEVYGLPAATGDPIDETSVNVSPTVLSLEVGQSFDLTERVQPTNATNKSVTWSSDDTNVATVDANGTVSAISQGTCTITVTTNNLGFTASCDVTIAQAAGTTQYYCDPVNGSMSNNGSQASPWSTLEDVFNAGKTFNPGDVINLLSGYHGSVSISGNNTGYVIIQAAAGNQPTLRNISLSNASYWTFIGLELSPELASTYSKTTVFHLGNSNNIIVDNCEVFSVNDISSWTANDWVALSCYGIFLEGSDNIIRNCTVRNIKFGISLERNAHNNLIENNVVQNFSGDGTRVLGNYNTFLNNTYKDNYNVDDNHDDGIQSFSIGDNYSVGGSTVYGNVISGNTFIQTTDPNRPFQGSLQGIGLFDGMFEDWVIENNVIICDVYHGIAIFGGINCKVINNTVVDGNSTAPVPWIKVTAHKDGTPSSGNIVRNNIVANMANDANIGEVDNNIEISYVDYSAYFVDYADFDLNLISSSPAIDAGNATDAPTTDINGTARPQGSSYDIGAYEFIGTPVIVDVTGVSVSPDNITLIIGLTSDLTESIEPINATNRGVTWSSDDNSIAIVNASGLVTAVSEGNAVITVTTDDGNFTATCNVTVADNTTGNIALNKTGYSSSNQNDSYSAQNAFDGLGSTRWASERNDPQWIYADLGQTYSINQVVLNWETAYASAYEIQVSNDATNWTSIYSTNTEDGGTDDITGLSGSGRYIRMYGTARGTYYAYSLYEFAVYGTKNQGGTPVKAVSIDQTSLSLNEGSTATLTKTITPGDAANQTVTWSSSDINIATVDANGLVSAVSAGNATITVKTNDGGFSADCQLTVIQEIIPVDGVTVSPTIINLTTDGPQTTSATPVFYWDMETENATIYKPGSDSIPFYSLSNSHIKRDNTTAYEGNWSLSTQDKWSSVTFDNNTNEEVWAPVTEGTVELYWQYHEPWGDLMLFQMTGKSSTKDPFYDTNEGVVIRTRGGDPGEFYSAPGARNKYHPIDLVDGRWYRFRLRYKYDKGISIQIDDGPQYHSDATTWGPTECLAWHQILIGNDRNSLMGQNIDNFTVYDHWLEDDGTTTVPNTYQLTETVSPANATDKSVTWSSSNTNIATVNANGVVTPVAKGNATITVTTNDGGFTAECTVIVDGGSPVVNVTDISLDKATLSLHEGQFLQLTETISPENATNKNVTWSSNDTNVATVDANGLVTAISAGSVTITVTTEEGGYTISCAVLVKQPITTSNIISEKQEFTIYPIPVTGSSFMIDIKGYNEDEELNLRIYDVTGKMVYSLNNIDTHQIEIPCNLSKGAYIINIDNGSFAIQEKLIVR